MRYWVGTVSREHVLIGVADGFAMMNHGKLAPLHRLSPGDGLVYYSPKTAYPDGAPLKAFTAIGWVRDADPYPAQMRTGGVGYRRDIDWMTATETPIQSLSEGLEFTGETGVCWLTEDCSKFPVPIFRPFAPP